MKTEKPSDSKKPKKRRLSDLAIRLQFVGPPTTIDDERIG